MSQELAIYLDLQQRLREIYLFIGKCTEADPYLQPKPPWVNACEPGTGLYLYDLLNPYYLPDVLTAPFSATPGAHMKLYGRLAEFHRALWWMVVHPLFCRVALPADECGPCEGDGGVSRGVSAERMKCMVLAAIGADRIVQPQRGVMDNSAWFLQAAAVLAHLEDILRGGEEGGAWRCPRNNCISPECPCWYDECGRWGCADLLEQYAVTTLRVAGDVYFTTEPHDFRYSEWYELASPLQLLAVPAAPCVYRSYSASPIMVNTEGGSFEGHAWVGLSFVPYYCRWELSWELEDYQAGCFVTAPPGGCRVTVNGFAGEFPLYRNETHTIAIE
jgi:hypothetical protein